MNRSVRAAAWLGLLGIAIVALRHAAVGVLSPPGTGSLDALGAWADERGPAAAAMALVRYAAEVAAWYLLVVSVLHLLGGMIRIPVADVLADALSLPGVKRLLQAALGVGLAMGATSPGEVGGRSVPTAGERISRATPPLVVQERVDPGTATMRPIETDDGRGTAIMAPVAGADTGRESADSARETTWRVEQHDSFWSIAKEVLERAWGRAPSDPEIDPFWRALVDVNRSRLVSEDPDVVLPGQVFEVPPVPGPGRP